MNKQTLIETLATKMDIKKSEVETFLTAYEETLVDTLFDKDEFPIAGSKLKVAPVKAKPAREATNPKDPQGAKVHVEAKDATFKVKLSLGKKMKEMFK